MPSAFAGAWDWGSRFRLSASGNDNAGFVTEDADPQSTFRMLAAYYTDIYYLSDSSTLRFEPKITRDYYPDKDKKQLESTDIFLPGSYSYRRQRTAWGLGFNLSRQNVISDESSTSESGTTTLRADDLVYQASLTPSVNWYLSPKDQVSLGLSLGARKYNLDFTSRADSKNGSLFFSYNRSFTERQSLGFSATALNYKSENDQTFCVREVPIMPPPPPGEPQSDFERYLCSLENNSSSTSLTLDYSFRFSPTSTLSLKAGQQQTTSDNQATDLLTGQQTPKLSVPFDSSTYDISYRKILRRGEFQLSAGRGVTANSNGQPQDRYDFSFNGDFQLTEKLSTNWLIQTWQQQNVVRSAIEDETGNDSFDRLTRYITTELQLNWRFSQRWNIGGSYKYRYRDRDGGVKISPDTMEPYREPNVISKGNSVSVGVTYMFKRAKR